EWGVLAAVLCDPEFLGRAWPGRSAQILVSWNWVESNSPLRLVEMIRPLLEQPEPGFDLLLTLAELLLKRGHYLEARDLHRRTEATARSQRDSKALQAVLGQMAIVSQQLGDHDAALRQLTEQENLCRQPDDDIALAANLGNQAVVLRFTGQLE